MKIKRRHRSTAPQLMKFNFPVRATWEKLLGQWSDIPDCGEKKLLCAVIALAIEDQKRIHEDFRPVANGHGFFGQPLENYCVALGISADYVRRQILTAATRDGDLVEIAA